MEKVLTNAQMREADRHTIENLGISPYELMQCAGNAIADETAKLNKDDILVVCGTGNNGGDGYVCAEALRGRGFGVKVYALDGNLSDECKRAKQDYKGSYSRDICGAIIIDCIFGTGLSRNVGGEFAEVIGKINSSGAFVISADIPSGLSGDNGRVLGCAVKADVTVAIAEYKAGTFLNDGADYCGKTVKCDIGIVCPEANYINIYTDEDISAFYPKRRRNSHKGTYGAANVVAGSDRYIGAAALATEAALKSGCGYVKLTTTEKVKCALAGKFPQTIFLDKPDLSSDAMAIGMGCGVSEELYRTIGQILENFSGALLIDADGLNTLSKYGVGVLDNKSCKVILTPHVKEFSRLTGLTVEAIISDPVGTAKAFAAKHNVTIILKSAVSVITDGMRTALNIRGNSALAKGGSGDMLSGYTCGCLARGLAPFEAAVCAAYTMGVAAELAAAEKTEYCATAKDVIKNLHLSVKRLTD